MMPAADADAFPARPNDDWAEHDFATGGGNNDARGYLSAIAARYGDVSTLVRFVRAAQMANYESLRALYEGRVAQLFHPATGVLTWMTNPSQPSTTWQIYSYDLEPFGSYFGARKGAEQVHVQLDPTSGHIQVINHLPRPMPGLACRTRVYGLDGVSLIDRTADVPTLEPGTATDLGAIALAADAPALQFVRLALISSTNPRDALGALGSTDARPAVISDNFYWRNVAREGDLTGLDTLPLVTLGATVVRADRGGAVHLEVTLSNPGPVVALQAHVQLRRRRTGARVLPVWYSDNYVSLLPGETRTVGIDAAAVDLGGDVPLVTLDGWNVTTTAQSWSAGPSGGGVSVAPNRAAIVPPVGGRAVRHPL
jgi:hypothetical protein